MKKNWLYFVFAIAILILLPPLFRAKGERDSTLDQDLQSSLQVRPVPEYAQTQSVLISEYLFEDYNKGVEFAREILKANATLLVITSEKYSDEEISARLQKKGLSPDEINQINMFPAAHESYWIRDFGPLPLVIVNNNSYAELLFADFIYRDESNLDDTIPYQTGLYMTSSLIHVPVAFDGGNFMTNGSSCFATNDFSFVDDQHKETYQDASHLLGERVGCSKFVIIGTAPHVHIDMWTKVVNRQTILINEITDDMMVFAEIHLPKKIEEIRKTKSLLDQSAQYIAKYMKVERIPMPLPYDTIFRTYANSVLVNGTAIIPSYRDNLISKNKYLDYEKLPQMEKKVGEIYGRYGYKVRFLNADDLIINGGALHCVSIGIPKISSHLFTTKPIKKRIL